MDHRPTFLTFEEFAEELRISHDTVRRMVADGRVVAVRLSERVTRIPASELERLASPPDEGEAQELTA